MAVRSWLAGLEREAGSPNTVAKAYRLLARILDTAVEAGTDRPEPLLGEGRGHRAGRRDAGRHRRPGRRPGRGDRPRFRALVLVAAYAGLRWGELVGLRVKRVDLLHARITVAEQATEIDGHFTRGPPKTEAGRRTVTLPAVAAAALAEHLTTTASPARMGWCSPPAEGGLLRRSNFNRRVWRPAIRAVGLDGLRFHDLRHTSATLSIAAGASTRELMARMGHSSSAAALRYQHVMAGRDAAIAAALDELIEAASALAESPPSAPSGTRVARIGQSGSGKKRR